MNRTYFNQVADRTTKQVSGILTIVSWMLVLAIFLIGTMEQSLAKNILMIVSIYIYGGINSMRGAIIERIYHSTEKFINKLK